MKTSDGLTPHKRFSDLRYKRKLCQTHRNCHRPLSETVMRQYENLPNQHQCQSKGSPCGKNIDIVAGQRWVEKKWSRRRCFRWQLHSSIQAVIKEKSMVGCQYDKSVMKYAYLPWCSYLRVIVGWSQTSAGPKYWMGPGYTYEVLNAHSSRLEANFWKGAPSRWTRAFCITGFILP